MRQARHQYSIAPHTAHGTVILTVLVVVACVAVEEWTLYLFLAMSACPVTIAVVGTKIHITKDMALCALELHLVVECV